MYTASDYGRRSGGNHGGDRSGNRGHDGSNGGNRSGGYGGGNDCAGGNRPRGDGSAEDYDRRGSTLPSVGISRHPVRQRHRCHQREQRRRTGHGCDLYDRPCLHPRRYRRLRGAVRRKPLRAAGKGVRSDADSLETGAECERSAESRPGREGGHRADGVEVGVSGRKPLYCPDRCDRRRENSGA